MKLANNIDKFGTIGMFFTAIFSPCCFPLFAFAASALGFGSFELFGGWTMWIFQGMVVISLIGLFLSYRRHKSMYPLLIAILSTFIIFYSYYFSNNKYQAYFLYTGMFGLLIATIVNYYRNKLHNACNTCEMYNGKSVELKSKITCPNCGHKKEEIMPTDACQFFYECESCRSILKPKQSDCCVFCSYGTVKCPPIQNKENCC